MEGLSMVFQVVKEVQSVLKDASKLLQISLGLVQKKFKVFPNFPFFSISWARSTSSFLSFSRLTCFIGGTEDKIAVVVGAVNYDIRFMKFLL